MSSGLLYRTLQDPTTVTAVCSVQSQDGDVVVQLQDTQLSCWRVGQDGLEKTASWRAPASMLQMVQLPGNSLLLVAEGGRCFLHRLDQQHLAAGAAAPALEAQAQLQVPIDSTSSQVQPFGCVVSGNVLSAPSGSGFASLAAVVYAPGVLHVIKASPALAHSLQAQDPSSSSAAAAAGAAEGRMQVQTKAMALTPALLSCHSPGGDPPSLASVRVAIRVLSMVWLSPQEQQLDLQGRSLLAVLHEMTVGSQPPVLHVDCVAVNWLDGTLTAGPWSLRNVHPTTQLLQPFLGSPHLPPGILTISSRGVQLCTCLGSKLAQPGSSSAATSSSAALHEAAAAAAAVAAANADSTLLASAVCVRQVEVLQWMLGGLRLSCAVLCDGCYLVGDSKAGLHLFKLPHTSSSAGAWLQLQPSGCLALPDLLLYVPLGAQQQQTSHQQSEQQQQQQQQSEQAGREQQHMQQQLAGLLVVGSKCSSSQVLGITQQLWDVATGSVEQVLQQQQQRQQHQQRQQQAMKLPILQSALTPSLASAQAVAVYQDPAGSLPEQQLLVACGLAPRGKLAVVRSGCGLQPTMLDGPEIPGDAALFASTQPQPCQHKQHTGQLGAAQSRLQQHAPQQQRQPQQHSMLGFSFPSADASAVMSLEGQTFRQLQLSGLNAGQASLLITSAPGGWLLQVTASGVRVLSSAADGQLQNEWTPTGGTISLAAACGSHLVVACGAHLTCLNINCCHGTLTVIATAELQQQASALNMFALQEGQLVVAVGLWVDNSILLMTCPTASAQTPASYHQQQPVQLQAACCVELDADQPRSIALLPVGTADVMLVGSNTGKVLMWEVVSGGVDHTQQQQPQQVQPREQQGQDCSQQQQQQQHLAISLQHARAVQVGNSSVSLQHTWLPDAQASAQAGYCTGGAAQVDQRAAVPCVVAHAGSMAVFRPHTALLAAQKPLNSTTAAAAAAAAGVGAPVGIGALCATACVHISRLCGSEACLGAAPVHTPDMPHSLAWVSEAHKLCFGSIAAEHKLRWRSCGVSGTPLAVAVHLPSDTIVLLLAADGVGSSAAAQQDAQQQQQQYSQQQLVVLDAQSLRVLIYLALAPGHTYTTLQVVDLPATSQQQQQQQAAQGSAGSSAGPHRQKSSSGGSHKAASGSSAGTYTFDKEQQQPGSSGGSPPGCLPFIVLGSHAVVAVGSQAVGLLRANAGAPGQPRFKRMGILSVFELRKAVVQVPASQQQQQGSSMSGMVDELRYDLILYGMVPLQCTPASACTVVPKILPPHLSQQQQQQPGPAAQHNPRSAPSKGAGSAAAQASAAAVGPQVPSDVAAAAAAASPLLVVGSEAGLTLLRVMVDDARLADKQQLEQLLSHVHQVPDVDSAASSISAPQQQQQQQQQQADGEAAPGGLGQQSILCGGRRFGRVSVQELSSATALFQGVVTKVASSGDYIVALESLGPVTAFTAVCDTPGGWVQLLPVGMDDQSRLMAVDFVIEDVQRHAAAAEEERAAAEAAAAQDPDGIPEVVSPMDQGLLVGTHPAGLMLMQQDVYQEAQVVREELAAARMAWEAGRRPPEGPAYGGGILMPDPVWDVQGVPWQGAGEAAPWSAAAAGLHQQIEQQLQQLMLAGRVDEDRARSIMARVAEYAAGRQAGDESGQAVRVDWLGLIRPVPSLAPQLMSSASCAPAPGSMLMCKARLGLHAAPVDSVGSVADDSTLCGGADGHNAGNQGGSKVVAQHKAVTEPNTTVLCLSASGGVAAVQLLPPDQTSQLLSWQSGAVLNPRAVAQLLQWGQLGQAHGGGVSAADAANSYLRGLPVPDEAASYEGYGATPGALDNSTGRTVVVQTAAQLEQQQQRADPVSTVFGDALLMGVQEGGLGERGLAEGVMWQHLLWQETV